MHEAGVEEFDPLSEVTNWNEFYKMRDYYSNLIDRYYSIMMMDKELPPEYHAMKDTLYNWIEKCNKGLCG